VREFVRRFEYLDRDPRGGRHDDHGDRARDEQHHEHDQHDLYDDDRAHNRGGR
jgi:hypothetical protein